MGAARRGFDGQQRRPTRKWRCKSLKSLKTDSKMAFQRVQSPGTRIDRLTPLSQPRTGNLLERPLAMRRGPRDVGRNAMLFLRAHLAEGAVMAVRPKDRIVAKSGRPSRREDKDPIHSALESFVCAIRPG